MPTRTKHKKVLKAKKRASISFEKEPWYASAAARFSAVRSNQKSFGAKDSGGRPT